MTPVYNEAMRYFYFGFLKSILKSFQAQLGILIITGALLFFPEKVTAYLGIEASFMVQNDTYIRLIFYGMLVFFVLNILGRGLKKLT